MYVHMPYSHTYSSQALQMPKNLSTHKTGARTKTTRPRVARSERLEARLTVAQKKQFGDAAELLGESVSQFVLRAAEARAHYTLIDEQMVKLTSADRLAMIDALSSPPKPTKALRAAFARYQDEFM